MVPGGSRSTYLSVAPTGLGHVLWHGFPRRKPWVGPKHIPQAPGRERDMSHTSGNILLHVIFSTRARRPLIKSDFRADLFAYLGGIIREMGGTALIINGTADHVHMLVRIRPAQSSAQIVRTVKANSSRWVYEEWGREFGWQTGCSASANRTSRRSRNISPNRRSIIRSIRFRRSLLRS